jgi:hypothetical protein
MAELFLSVGSISIKNLASNITTVAKPVHNPAST